MVTRDFTEADGHSLPTSTAIPELDEGRVIQAPHGLDPGNSPQSLTTYRADQAT